MPEQSTLLSQSLVQSAEQSAIRDPFQKAQAKADLLSQSPMQAIQAQQQQMNPTKAANQLFAPPNPEDYGNFLDSALPKALDKMGIPSRGIPLNDLGKVTLMGRLQSRFGVQYGQNPEAINVMQLFDKALGKAPQDNMKESVSAANRTLGALLGG